MTADRQALVASLARKVKESAETQRSFFDEQAEPIAACAQALAAALEAGGRLFAAGNGGSACDAQHVAVEFMHPVIEKRPAHPAQALTTDTALLTAIGNDEEFSLAFARQIERLARPGDVLIALSTSGKSASVLRAVRAAAAREMLTIGFAGRDGGRLAELCDHAFVVPSFNIHRIQEAHVTLLHVLWDLTHVALGADDVL